MTGTNLNLARLIIAFNLVFLAIFCAVVPAGVAKKPPSSDSFQLDRAQMMIFNLNRTPESAGLYILKSLKDTQAMIKVLEKANRQIEQADRSYAKSRNRPDDRFLTSAQEQLKQSQKTAEQLEAELSSTYDDLKLSIQQTLVGQQ